MAPDPKLDAFKINYDPIEDLSDNDWPQDPE